MDTVDTAYYASLPITSERGANKIESLRNKLTPVKLCLDLLQLEGITEEQRQQLLKDNLPIAQDSMQHILAILNTIKC